ncbi:MAG: pyridoxamine 5'-phosphate oxidase [Gemmatimonadales bacterium]
MSLEPSPKTTVTEGQSGAGAPPRDLVDAAEGSDPIELFETWFAAAQSAGAPSPESVALATATPEAAPSVRMVLLKGVDSGGFVFFTNYGSRKAREMDANPRAALCFHWAVLQRQVRVSGRVARIDADASAAYFATRPRGSQIGAWASRQSESLVGRQELEAAVHALNERFAGRDVPLPTFWGGYRLEPDEIEFWQGRTDRLHDRLVYTRSGSGWSMRRLYP